MRHLFGCLRLPLPAIACHCLSISVGLYNRKLPCGKLAEAIKQRPHEGMRNGSPSQTGTNAS